LNKHQKTKYICYRSNNISHDIKSISQVSEKNAIKMRNYFGTSFFLVQ